MVRMEDKNMGKDKLRKRDEIPAQYKWNMQDMFATDELWEEEAQQVLDLAKDIEQYKGRLSESAATLLAFAKKLDEYRMKQREFIFENGYTDLGYVIISTIGTPLDPRSFQRDFKLLLRRNNIREVNVHGLRHTFATRALESGMSPKTLSKILGHSSVGFTLDTYAHVTDDLKFTEMQSMNNFL